MSKDGKSRLARARADRERDPDRPRIHQRRAAQRQLAGARPALLRHIPHAGASGIKRKAFDAALDAMIDAQRRSTSIHTPRASTIADVVDRLEQRAASEIAPAEPHNLQDIAGRLQKAVDTLADGGVELVPGPSAPTVVDELHATFDHDAITLAGRTDDGAWHRAIEVARKLVAAGIWNGDDRIEFDAYALHDKLFGVNRVEPKDLVPGDDYSFPKPAVAPESPAEAEPEHASEYAYLRFAVAARAILDYIPGVRAGEEVAWADIDDQRRQEARELLDALSAAAVDLSILLSEISQKLGAA